jgi:hypothetical protein
VFERDVPSNIELIVLYIHWYIFIGLPVRNLREGLHRG